MLYLYKLIDHGRENIRNREKIEQWEYYCKSKAWDRQRLGGAKSNACDKKKDNLWDAGVNESVTMDYGCKLYSTDSG
jgi:hypothetical protein